MGTEGCLKGKTKNGLQYYLYPQKTFGDKAAAIVVKRGANHLFWKGQNRNEIHFPMGTAHFIEHKLFQQKWGDAFVKFGENGASANAFTDGDKTVYYFSCRDGFMENLELLLDFVQHPFFTEEDTEREKSIILSEISMYKDDPDRIVYEQMLEGMYVQHPIRNSIAGTMDSVQEITAEILQKAYEVYYTTENMALICTGDIPVAKVRKAAECMQRKGARASVIFPAEGRNILEKYQEQHRGMSRPHFQIGFKLPPVRKENRLKDRIAMGFLLEILAGESSLFYQKAYEQELLDEPMGTAYFCGEGYAFAAFSAVGEQPEETAELLLQELLSLQKKGLSEETFYRIRRKMIGRFLRVTDSPISLCMRQTEWAMMDADVMEIMKCIKTLPISYAEKLLQNAFLTDTMVLSVVR